MRSKILKVEYIVTLALTVLVGGLIYGFWQDLKNAFWGSEQMGRVVLPEVIIRVGIFYVAGLVAIYWFKFRQDFELKKSLLSFLFLAFVNSVLLIVTIISLLLFDVYSFESDVYIAVAVNLITLVIFRDVVNSSNELILKNLLRLTALLLLPAAFLVYQIENFQFLAVSTSIGVVSALFANMLSRLAFQKGI